MRGQLPNSAESPPVAPADSVRLADPIGLGFFSRPDVLPVPSGRTVRQVPIELERLPWAQDAPEIDVDVSLAVIAQLKLLHRGGASCGSWLWLF